MFSKRLLIKKWFAYFVLSLGMVACSTVQSDTSASNYENIVAHFSDRAEFYEGFTNVFQFQATVLNETVLKSQIEKRAQSYSWTATQKADEEAKMRDSLNKQTTIFLSFYSPEPKIDDLERAQSLWRVFLDVNNKRYIGTVSKYVGVRDETMMFFPYYTRFSSAYTIKFLVPMVEIQHYPMKLTLTGTIGSDSINFAPMQ